MVVVVFSAGGSVAAPTERVNQLRCCLTFHPTAVTWSENTSIIALTLVDRADVSEVGVAVEVVPESIVFIHVDAVLRVAAAAIVGLALIN